MHSKSRVDRTSSQKQTLWNDHRKSEFVANLDKEMIKNTLTTLNTMREQDEISQEQDIAVHKKFDIFNKAAKNTFKQKNKIRKMKKINLGLVKHAMRQDQDITQLKRNIKSTPAK